MAHVQLVERANRLIPKVALRYSRHRFGRVVEPVAAAAHHAGVLLAMGALETTAERGWRRLDPGLRWLAIEASAMEIGCSWCIDYGYYEGMRQGTDPIKVREVLRWRTSEVYDERERAVLEYAEAATSTPATITDELIERLHRHFTEPVIVELAAWVAMENFRSRFNAGLGLRSQGFSDNCDLPTTVGSTSSTERVLD
ncbi:MAG TPA: carboxymuconolactone decarboxylase family protein [Acidimicrobiales bacterium]|nr:carboxymuconolactone decarboxylase family protein [Acidimicrobiales bacterium]